MAVTQTPNRSADASIRGYIYQFDRAVLRILSSSAGDVLTVEGIEDIDLLAEGRTTAEQCKYLPAANFSLARIRDAVAAMLDYYSRGHQLDYCLYIHTASQSSIPSTLSADEIRSCLTVTSKKSGVTTRIYEKYDADTVECFANHLRIVPGEEYDVQHLAVVDALSREYACSVEEARIYYYPAALNSIVRLAIQSNVEGRRTSKSHFRAQLDNKKYLYSTWHAELVGVEVFVEQLAKDLGRSTRIRDNYIRFLAVTLGSAKDVEPAVMLTRILATKFYGAGKLHNALPWTMIIDATDDVMHLLKSAIVSAGIAFNDGYEAYGFSVELFGRRPITARRGRSNKIAKASFELWIVSLENLNEHQDSIAEPNLVLAHSDTGQKFCTPFTASVVVELGQLALADLNHVMERIR